MVKTAKIHAPLANSASRHAFFGCCRKTPFFPQVHFLTPVPHSVQRTPEQPITPGSTPSPPTFPAVSAPAQAPTFVTPSASLATAICGSWQTAPNRATHSQCIYHVQFVEAMRQSRDNIRAVNTPYSATIASFYDSLLTPVTLTRTHHPAPGRAINYTYRNLSIALSRGITLNVPNFELVLEQNLSSTRSHGAISGYTLTLNEMPPVSHRGQADIERTLYHEMIHFIHGEVDQLNRTHRQTATAGQPAQVVHPEFDSATYATSQPLLEAALAPVFLRALQRYAPIVDAQRLQTLASAYAGLQWVTWLTEAIARVEEAIYMARRTGHGFTHRDLINMSQGWLQTPQYWRNAHVAATDMQTHIASERQYIDQHILPIVRQIQTDYLRRRP